MPHPKSPSTLRHRIVKAALLSVSLLALWLVVANSTSKQARVLSNSRLPSSLSVDRTPAVAILPSAEAHAGPMTAFADWSQTYLAAPVAERHAWIPAGVALAKERRSAFKDLIQSDPKAAIEQAVPMVVRQQLPTAILGLLEQRINDVGVLRVLQAMPLPGGPLPSGSMTIRKVELRSGKTYQAHVYGRRAEKLTWTPHASLNGVALDADLAVSDEPSRTLEVGEVPSSTKPVVSICPISGETTPGAVLAPGEAITAETPAVETATQIVHFCGPIHINLYNQTLIMGEGVSGGAFGFTGILPAAPTPALGTVKVLAIPMTYADQNSVPSTEAALYTTLRDVADFYAKASFGRLTLVGVVSPPVKLPHNEAWYVNRDTSNGGDIDGEGVEHNHAREEARKLGFDSNDYDCIVVRHNGGPGSYGGLGGGSSVWARSDSVSLWAHEIGHCFGLGHSNFWDTAGSSAIGAGTNAEYGDNYDIMGGGPYPAGHYNTQAKSQIKWLPQNFVENVTQSGQYRIFAFDQGTLIPSRRYAMTIVKDAQKTYWGEVRTLFDSNPWVKNGLLLGWRYPNGSGGNLQRIDTTPGSPFAKDDAPISLGRTFSDTESGIHLTTVAVNDSPRSMDVVVNFEQYPDNQRPALTLAASATVIPTGATVTFTATASDPDGDALAYSWQHFGDTSVRLVSGNTPVITRTFSSAGTYIVSCTVSDMKGGSTTRNQLVTVGNGNSRYTISGRVTLLGHGLQDVVITANNSNGVVTDADGYYTIPNLAANTYTMTPLLYGYTFGELFNNSVTVGPNAANADFEATSSSVVTIVASTSAAGEASPVTPGVFTLTRTGDVSQPLVVNVNTALGSAAKGTAAPTNDYYLTPDYAAGSQGFSTFTIPADVATLDVVVTPNTDTTQEGPETVTLQLGPGNGYLVGAASSATVVIDDDDTALPKVSLAATTPVTSEGSASPALFTFTRTGGTSNNLTVNYAVSGTASSGADFAPLVGNLAIPAGQASATVAVTALDDAISEPLETVRLTVSTNAAYVIDPLSANASANLIDDDVQTVVVQASDPSAREVDLTLPNSVADTGTFVVTRSGDLTSALTVFYAVTGVPSSGVAALHGVDYQALPGSVVIPAGATQAAVTIVPRFDGIGEGPETVLLQLGSGSTNYVLGTPSSAAVTVDDGADTVPYVEVVPITSAAEPSSNGTFRITARGIVGTTPLTLNYMMSGSAGNGTDYDSGTVWAPQSSGTVAALRGVWVSDANNAWAVGDG
ncbi:MAG: Calx-beta domain-containing protein, partial [Roseimicrobium sp.]